MISYAAEWHQCEPSGECQQDGCAEPGRRILGQSICLACYLDLPRCKCGRPCLANPRGRYPEQVRPVCDVCATGLDLPPMLIGPASPLAMAQDIAIGAGGGHEFKRQVYQAAERLGVKDFDVFRAPI